jgi:hypothetical protein
MRKTDIVHVILFATLVFCGIFAFLSAERNFYSWDEANFSNTALEAYRVFFPDDPKDPFQPVVGLKHVYVSFARDTNFLYAVPLLPAMRVFGTGRTVQVLAISLLYFVPFCVAWGFVATRVFQLPARVSFWGTVLFFALMPLAWMSVTHGYPDVGASALVGAAIAVYLTDVALRDWRRMVLMGALLAIMPLFRRHYLYAAIAFWLALAIHQIILWIAVAREDGRGAGRDLFRRAIALTLIAVTQVVLLFVVGGPFVRIVIANNYFDLYRSYMQDPWVVATTYFSVYGAVLSCCSVVGYVWGIRSGTFRKPEVGFVILFGVISFVLWAMISRQLGIHYTNHFNFLFVFGILAFCVGLRRLQSAPLRVCAFIVVTGLLAYRLLVGFAVVKSMDSLNPNADWIVANPPIRRADFSEVQRLLARLRDLAPPPLPIFIAGSSRTFNPELVANAEKDLYGLSGARLVVPPHAAVDSRDFYPIESLARAHVVAVATPGQYHLRPEEQRVVLRVVEMFEKGEPPTRDFELLPDTFSLENGVTVRFYRRARSTPPEVIAAELEKERELTPIPPGQQKKWVSLDSDLRYDIHAEGPVKTAEAYNFLLHAGSPAPWQNARVSRQHFFLFLGAAPAGSRLRGRIEREEDWKARSVTLIPVRIEAGTGRMIARGAPVTVREDETNFDVAIPAAPGDARAGFEIIPDPGGTPATKGRLVLLEVRIGS